MFSGIRQLQLILLKVSLLLGVEVHTGVEFQSLIEPSGENGTYIYKPAITLLVSFAHFTIIRSVFLHQQHVKQ